MKLTFGGVRGTEPTPGADYAFYGGNSTSMLVEAEGDRALILDMGSGVTAFADTVPALVKNRAITMLMSHYHLDHVCGLPRFSPIYNAEIELDCFGPKLHGHTCDQVLHTLMSKPLWPIPLYSLGEKNRFHTLERGEDFDGRPMAGFHVRWCTLHHFEGCMAYRIEDPRTGRSLVIATDVEWRESSPAERKALLALCSGPRPADVLVFDGHYADAEYPAFKGWGHSTWQDAVEVARLAGLSRLYITHHAPAHNDRQLALMEEDLRREMPSAAFAREGMVVDV